MDEKKKELNELALVEDDEKKKPEFNGSRFEDIFKEAEESVDKITGKKEESSLDIPIEETVEETAKETGAETPKESEQIEELKDKLLRTMADFQNYRQRIAREKTEMVELTRKEVFASLLPVIDNFERAFSAEGDSDHILKGLEMVYKQFTGVLRQYSVERIEPKAGDMFDPLWHEAVEQVITEEFEQGVVVKTQLAGFKAGGKLIRAAQVAVAKRPAEGEAQKNG